MTEEQRKILQSLVDEAYEQFAGVVDGKRILSGMQKRINTDHICLLPEIQLSGL